MDKKILALFDSKGVYIYQAFDPPIAQEAVKKQTFGKNFYLDRLSWIKPSFGWMLYRSDYASKAGQTNILKIKVSRSGFLEILRQAVPTIQDPNLFESGKKWRKALQQSDVRYQWDPDRDSELQRLSRKALQIGLEGKVLENYVQKWIIGVEDVTALAKQVGKTPHNKKLWPLEEEFPIPKDIQQTLGMSIPCN